MNEILTKKEIAKKLKISERTIDNLRRSQGLPFAVVGRSIRFDEAAIDDWFRKRQDQNLSDTEIVKEKPTDRKNP